MIEEKRGAATTIRVAKISDASAVSEIYAPAVEDSITSFEMTAPTTQEVERRIAETLRRFPWLVAEKDGRVIGYAYAGEHRTREAYKWSVEVSVYVRAEARRHGLARALYTELFQLLRRLGYYNAYAGITLPNDASVGLHESLGFKKIGVYRAVGHKMGAWRDVGWWQLALQEHGAAPAPPLNFEELSQ